MFTNTPLNEERNYDHKECGDTRARFYVKRTAAGWVYNCFNCGHSGFKPATSTSSLDELRERLNGRNLERSNTGDSNCTLRLPYDVSYSLPNAASIWLGRYDITEDETKRYRFCYSEKLNRLILPLYNREGELVFFQGRTLGKPSKENPKYLNVRGPKEVNVIFKGLDSTSIVIVEDIVSAIKVSRLVDSLPILGSHISPKTITTIKDYERIYLFLDYDKRFESLKYSSRVRVLTGKPCMSVIQELDPKCYSEEELKRILQIDCR